MSDPQGSWNDRHYIYRPPWGSGDAYGDRYDDEYGSTYGDDGYGTDGYGDASYAGDGYSDQTYAGEGYGPGGSHGDAVGGAGSAIGGDYRPAAGERSRPPVGASVRGAFGGLAWRYRSAPLWARATLDVSAAALAVALLLGASLALWAQGDPDRAEVAPPTSSTTLGGPGAAGGPLPTGSNAFTTTTSTIPPSTRPATTRPTTAVAPATTAAPATTTTTTPHRGRPPGSTAPTTSTPATTQPQEQHAPYRSCFEAWQDGALPLFAGEPGYSSRLDDDGDGEACEWGEG